MNTEIVLRVSRDMLAGRLSFGDGVRELAAAGMESYNVDYVAFKKTFYGSDGLAVVVPLLLEDLPLVADHLMIGKLQEAIRDSQLHGQKYRDFSRRAMEAGVMGYLVFPRGRRVVYFGRDGEQHLEWFPGAAPRNAAA